tara:strand:+ start:2762 stop:3520 length:759 start_codon:yes stop_codon:yes gene_type:complete
MKLDKSFILYGFISILLIVCVYIFANGFGTQSAYNKIDFGGFEVTVPEDWYEFKIKGIDSYVGGVTNGKDSLTFDFGWYSYDFKYEESDKQVFATDTINGKVALFTKPRKKGNGLIGIYIERASGKSRFNLMGRDIKNEDLILGIFKSLKFKDSDNTVNSKTIEFTDEITPYSGRSLFLIQCASCHQRNRKMIGPALAGVSPETMREWIFETKKTDSTQNLNEYGVKYHRLKFGKALTENDIQKLLEYTNVE